MALPEQIAVRYTEDDAGYMSVRPVVKQTFRLPELVDMVVSVAGKDAARVGQIFRSGTVVYHGYRYWWDALQAENGEVERLLAGFPEDDPARPFSREQAASVLLEMGGGTQRTVTEILRQDAAEKKLFARQSPWDVLIAWAAKRRDTKNTTTGVKRICTAFPFPLIKRRSCWRRCWRRRRGN